MLPVVHWAPQPLRVAGPMQTTPWARKQSSGSASNWCGRLNSAMLRFVGLDFLREHSSHGAMSGTIIPLPMQAAQVSETYDAIVVGSGATGGWAAKRLAEAGLKVALLEAGRNISPKEFTEHMPAYKLKYRDMSPEIARTRPVQKQCYACMEYNYDWFVDDLQNPYSTPAGKPFTWQRLRIVGGRT